MDERRDEPRADVEIEVHYRTVQEFLRAYSRNISGGGIFIKTSRPHALNQNVHLRFTLPGVDRRFEMPGIVVWENASTKGSLPAGMGIKFLEVTPGDAEIIRGFVKQVTTPSPASDNNKKE
jgi:type IV pilus assembly protein PilZ